MDTVTLAHGMHKANRVEFLYDTLYVVKEGRVTVPSSRPDHLRALHNRGYNCGVNGERLWTTVELDQYAAAQ
jgi:hypothetical protein